MNPVCWNCDKTKKFRVLDNDGKIEFLLVRPCSHYLSNHVCHWKYDGVSSLEDPEEVEDEEDEEDGCPFCIHAMVNMVEFPCNDCIKSHRETGIKPYFKPGIPELDGKEVKTNGTANL